MIVKAVRYNDKIKKMSWKISSQPSLRGNQSPNFQFSRFIIKHTESHISSKTTLYSILLVDPTYVHWGKHVAPIDGEAQNARILKIIFLVSCFRSNVIIPYCWDFKMEHVIYFYLMQCVESFDFVFCPEDFLGQNTHHFVLICSHPILPPKEWRFGLL